MGVVRASLLASAVIAAVAWGCSDSSGSGGSGGSATGGSGGTGGTGGSGGSAGMAGSGGSGEGGSGGSELAAPGKFRMTVGGKVLETDGTFNLFGGASGAGGYFPNGANTSVGITGTQAGTYTSEDGNVDWIFNDLPGQYRCKQDIAGSSCSVTMTLYGPNRGDHETGTFQGTLVRQTGTGPETVTVTNGSYDLLGN